MHEIFPSIASGKMKAREEFAMLRNYSMPMPCGKVPMLGQRAVAIFRIEGSASVPG